MKDAVLAKLDQFIFTEDVQLGDVTASFAQIAVVGPRRRRSRRASRSAACPRPRSQRCRSTATLRADWRGSAGDRHARRPTRARPGYDVFVERAQAEAFKAALTDAGVRVARRRHRRGDSDRGGVPLFHRDMDEETIPLEAGIESRAISFTKGCYVGQEVIIRVLHRGHGRVGAQARRAVDRRRSACQLPGRRFRRSGRARRSVA